MYMTARMNVTHVLIIIVIMLIVPSKVWELQNMSHSTGFIWELCSVSESEQLQISGEK